MSSKPTEMQGVTQSDCPECDGDLARGEHENHCTECGLVVAKPNIDHGPEWRSFDRDERKRTGAPRTVTMHDRGLSTEIGYGDRSDIAARKQRRLSRQRRLHSRSKFASKRDRNLAHGLGEIRRLTGALDQSDAVQKQASKLFEHAQEMDLLVGQSIESGAGAAVYAACRWNSVVRMSEIAAVARCSERDVWTTYRTFQRELDLPIPIPLPVEWIPRLLSELSVDIPVSVRREATRLAQLATDSPRINGNPIGIAASCVYLAAKRGDQKVTQAELSEAADVSPPTIRKWCKDIQAITEQ